MKTSHLLSATALAGMLVLAPTGAWAQDTAQPAADPAATPDETQVAPTEGQGGAIVVVGSRIRRNQFNTADPIQLITREDTTQAGFNSAADVLQSTAVTGGQGQINNSFGGFVTAGGPGANTLSLRGLGATRTLILLNGRRIAPAGSRGSVGSADLNVLPSAIVDRYEILNTGASSIYGSDAVAGVVNIVTRTNLNGIILEAQHDVTEDGGANSMRYSAAFGFSGDRFKITGSLEYYNRDELRLGQRDWAQCQISYRKANATSAPGTGDFIDPETGKPQCYPTGVTGESGVSVNLIGTPNFAGSAVALAPGAPAGYTGICNRFRPSSSTVGAVPGYECVGGGTLNINLRDTFPKSILNDSLVSPAETYTGFFQGSYEIAALGDAEVYAELLLNRRNSQQNSNRQLTIDYPQGSPLIPASLQYATPFLGPQAGGITGTNNIGIRVFSDYGNYNNRQSVDFAKITGGIRGDLFGGWRYDAYAMKTWSDADYTTDLILTTRIAQSLDVVAAGGGTFACRNPLGGCVAAPSITPAVVGGTFPAAWFDYITDPVTGHTKYVETVFNATFDGPLFRLPGGDLQAAVGVERRSNSIDDTPDPESQAGNLYGFTSSSITRGSDSVWEVFGELEAPLLADVPFFHRLTLNGSARYTNYKSYGGQTTYKVGGLWEPVSWLAFRGSYGTSYRAPALYEQYLGATSGFQSQNSDPCNNYNTTFAAGTPRYVNCASEVPLNFVATSSIQVNQLGGAASGLSAETSRNWTVGGVLQPKLGAFGDLSFSVDYFNVLVNNGVSQLSFSTILQQCYDDKDFRAESICSYVTRATTAPFALKVVTGYVNIATAAVSGFDFNLHYSNDIGPGRLRLTAAVTKYDQRYNQNLPTDPIDPNIGTLNNPEWTGTFNATYTWDRWAFRYGVEWLDATYSPREYLSSTMTQATRDTYVLETPDYFLHSASIRYKADHFGIILGVRNLMDTAPPQISSGFYNRLANAPLYSGYDVMGRTFFVNVTTSF